jgi:hypothetical protein
MHLFDQQFLQISNQSMDSSDCSVTDLMFDSDVQSLSNRSGCKPKRKREKLDHLSFEEKMNRRKMKNRISAQSARDRKKVKMGDLEHKIDLLSKLKIKIAIDCERNH